MVLVYLIFLIFIHLQRHLLWPDSLLVLLLICQNWHILKTFHFNLLDVFAFRIARSLNRCPFLPFIYLATDSSSSSRFVLDVHLWGSSWRFIIFEVLKLIFGARSLLISLKSSRLFWAHLQSFGIQNDSSTFSYSLWPNFDQGFSSAIASLLHSLFGTPAKRAAIHPRTAHLQATHLQATHLRSTMLTDRPLIGDCAICSLSGRLSGDSFRERERERGLQNEHFYLSVDGGI